MSVTRKDSYGNEVEVEVGQDGQTPVSPNNPLAKSQNFTKGLDDGIRETEPEEPVAQAINAGQYVFSYEPGPLKEYDMDEVQTEHAEGDPHGQYPHTLNNDVENNPAAEEVPSEKKVAEKDPKKQDDVEDHKPSKGKN